MYSLVRPLFFALDPHTAHAVAFAGLGALEHLAPLRAAVRAFYRLNDERLTVKKMGLVFPSPVGLAGGFDKNAQRPRAVAAFGFGHVELGTVTAEAQGPLDRPNLFRLPADEALVNRLGFPNEGAAAVMTRLAKKKAGIGVPVGVSIGKSRSVPLDPVSGVVDDYLKSFRAVISVADFVVVNVSSPNTKNLRSMQAAASARALFGALAEERAKTGSSVPLLVKIAPDLDDEGIDTLCREARAASFAGVVATNTTISREGLATPHDVVQRIGAGGLSGKPLFRRALAVVKHARTHMGPDACVIGVGGVDGTETALAMLRAGADLVQIYTGFIYRGPSLPRTIGCGLLATMHAEGARSVRELTSLATT